MSVFAVRTLSTCCGWAGRLRIRRACCAKQQAAYLFDDGFKQGRQVICQLLWVPPSNAIDPAGLAHREVALLSCGAQLAEEVEGGVDHKVRPAREALLFLNAAMIMQMLQLR